MNIWGRYSWIWTNLLWLIAGTIILIDPQRIYEFAHRHEGWSELIMAAFAIILAWANRQRSQSGPGPLKPPPGAVKMIALIMIVMLPVVTTSCAPTLGAHVHRLTVRRVEFVKCTVIAEKADTHFAEQSLEVCRDAFGVHPERK
jgi:hypothetical protein